MLDFSHTSDFDAEDMVWEASPPLAPEAPLDPLSLRVVLLARAEAQRSVRSGGAGARLWRWFLGGEEAPRPLANPHLEMLRRFCMFVTLGDGQSEGLSEAILGKGHYSARQLATARSLSMV
jgi:hypothetical protein